MSAPFDGLARVVPHGEASLLNKRGSFRNHSRLGYTPGRIVTMTNHTRSLPPPALYAQRCAGIEKGAARTVHETVGSVHVKHLYEIAKVIWG